jgi:HK97 family phage major capsid protein
MDGDDWYFPSHPSYGPSNRDRAREHVDKAKEIRQRAKRAGRTLTRDERRKIERHLERFESLRAVAEEEGHMGNDDEGLPSLGGEGGIYGYDKRGNEIRAFQAGDSIFRQRSGSGQYDADFWGEPENPVGKFFRASAVGPSDSWERRAVSSTAAGGDVIPDPIRDQILDRLKANSVLGRAGARFIPMESDSLAITRVSSGSAFGWTGEGSTASGSSDPKFTSVTLNSHTLRGIHKANRELVQDAPDFPGVLEREFIGSLNEELQRVALVGSGSSEEPRGLYNSTGDGVTKLDFGGSTAGTTPASSDAQWGEILRARRTLLDADHPMRGHAWIWNPQTEEQFESLTDANFQPLARPRKLADARDYVTTSAPTTLSPSSGLSDVSAIFYGDYSNMVVGMRMDPQVEILRERYADNFQLGFLSFLRADIQLERPSGFAILDRITT